MPYVTNRAEFLPVAAGNPFHDGSAMVPGAGGDARIGLGSNLTLNLSVNPDFGQVEVDPAVVNLSDVETFSFDVPIKFTHEGWRGRVRASAGVQASLSPDMVARFDEKLRRKLEDDFRDEPLVLPHCVWAVTCRAPA